MRSKRLIAVGAVIAALSLAVTACSAKPKAESNSGNQKTSITLGWNQPWYSYNQDTSNGNASANNNIKYLMNSQFWYVDPEGNPKADKSFGTFEKVSDNPLTVKYTVADGVKWSDGTPVDAADLLLDWAGQSENLNTIAATDVRKDDATGLPKNTKGKVFFDSSSPGLGLVKDTPKISDDGKSLTLVYSKPFTDWQYDMVVDLPAHAVTELALGIKDPEEAKQAFIKAVDDKDEAALTKIAQTYSYGFDYTKYPSDARLRLSDGPYVMKDLKENEYMTLTKNPGYKGSHEGAFDTITVRWNEDPMAQVQALQNGELDMFNPQVTTDVVKAAEKIKNVAIQKGLGGTFEHVDLTFNNKGPFDPASYGGDENKAKLVRQAFLHAYPRQEIVDKLIKPITPDATLRDSLIAPQGVPAYDPIVAGNGSKAYDKTDPALAKQLLAQAGVKTPVKVRVMYAKDNVRRVNEFQLLKPALAKAGFDLIDNGSTEWSAKLGDGTYDAVYFGWESTTPAVASPAQAIYGTAQINNLNGYSNKEVDSLFEQAVVATDADTQNKLLTQIEKIVIDDGYGLPIFQFPAANIYNKTRIGNPDPAVLAPSMYYGFWNWKVPSAN